MAINYTWTCTACGAANSAGTDSCEKCHSNAITSGIELGMQSTSLPLSNAKRFLIGFSLSAILVGILLERVSVPPMFIWYLGIGLAVLGFGSLLVASAYQRRKMAAQARR